jgi:TM2 domain-containing membrane protein YozV
MKHLTLSYYDGDGHTQTYTSDGGSFRIGSSANCDVRIEGLEPEVCEVYLAEGGYYARELGGRLAISDRPGPGYLEHEGTITLDGWLSLRVEIETAPHASLNPKNQPDLPSAPRSPAGAPASAAAPKTALVLGLLLPGGGQAYNGQPFKGMVLAALSVLVIPWLLSLWDARRVAQRKHEGGGRGGRGGPLWVALHCWGLLNLALLVLVILTMSGVLA